MDLERISDLQLHQADLNQTAKSVGFSSMGDVERFLDGLANGLGTANALHGAVFVLCPATGAIPSPLLSKATAEALASEIQTAQRSDKIVCSDTLGVVLNKIQIPSTIRSQLSSGRWTETLAAQVSAGSVSGRGLVWVHGYSIKVFVNGIPILSYTDIRDRSLETASDLDRRQGWNDGELLERCGLEDLRDRGRLGIWHLPDLHLLTLGPEEIIQKRLELFLKARLKGFENLAREYHLPSIGRVDLRIDTVDRKIIFVEVKWIGHSIKPSHKDTPAQTIRTQLRQDRAQVANSLSEDTAAQSGTQLAQYLDQEFAHKGYLAIYDCRPTREISKTRFANKFTPPPGVSVDKYRLYHVIVDPLPPSAGARPQNP